MKGKRRLIWISRIFVALGIILVGAFLVFRTETRDLDAAARSEASGEFIELADGFVHYHLSGPVEGPVVVLIHGFSVPDYVWEPTRSGLAEAGFKVLSYDLYGRGYSDRPELEYDLDLFVSQLEGLLEGLELGQEIHLVGLSMGGPIAARYTHQHPDQVQSLVLIAPEVVQTTTGDIMPMNIPGVGEYLMAVVMEPYLLPALQSGDFHQPENYPGWADLYRVQLGFKGTGRALLSTIHSLVSLDPEVDYQKIADLDLPVQLIWGTEDQTISRQQIEVLESILPGVEILIVEHAGHLPHYERPEVVNPALVSFLGGLTR